MGLRKRFYKPFKFYPPSVKKIYFDYNIQKTNDLNANVEEYSINKCELILCSNKFLFKDESDWLIEFEDQEYTFALHRWNWLLTSLSNNANEPAREWGLCMMRSWINNMLDNKDGYAWHPYTTGEIISNAFLFGILSSEDFAYSKQNDILPEDIKSGLNLMAVYLSNHLEYKGKGKTGNHVINNSRALLFAGIFLENEFYSDLSFSILRSNLPELVTMDGFLREGSSHYQFVFTRWILEMLWLSTLLNNNDMYNFMLPFATKLVKQCSFFIVEEPESDLLSIPLIGDVSPDFPVSWLSTLPFSIVARDIYFNKELNDKRVTRHDWTFLINQKSGLFIANL